MPRDKALIDPVVVPKERLAFLGRLDALVLKVHDHLSSFGSNWAFIHAQAALVTSASCCFSNNINVVLGFGLSTVGLRIH